MIHWTWIILVLFISVPVAYFLLGLATVSQGADLRSANTRLWCRLFVLVQAIDSGDDDAVRVALERAREVLER